MSKLGDKIRKSTRVEPQPLGFVTSRATKDASVVLAGMSKDARGAAELARRGADVVIIGLSGSPASTSDAKDLSETVVGGWLDGRSDGASAAFKEAGFDFVIFDPDKTASTAVLEENIGYVMNVPDGASDNELRAIEGFLLDALYVGSLNNALTVRRQMELRRISAVTRKPLMASVSGDISPSELQALRDTNVAVVVGDSPDSVERLRKKIDELPPRAKRKEDPDRPSPMLPRATPGVEESDEDDEE